MNRNQFLSILAAELSDLPKEEIEAAMEFYTEYLDDVGREHEKEAIESLGSPQKVARQIRSDYVIRQMDSDEESNTSVSSTKKGISAIWFAIAGIFAAPIAIPLALAFGAVAIAVILALFATIVAVGMCVVATFAVGVFMVMIGVMAVTTSWASAALLVGGGLIVVAVTIMVMAGVVIAAKFLFKLLIKTIHNANEKRRMKRMELNKVNFKNENNGGVNYEQQA